MLLKVIEAGQSHKFLILQMAKNEFEKEKTKLTVFQKKRE